MKTRLRLAAVVAAGLVVVCANVGAQTIELAPDSSIVFVRVSRMESVPGVSWLSGSWKGADRESPLRDLLSGVRHTEATVAVLPAGDPGEQRILMVLETPSPPGRAALVEMVTAEGGTANDSAVGGVTVTSVDEPGPGVDFAAFAVSESRVLLGSDAEAVRIALEGQSVTGSAGYAQMSTLVNAENDGLLFADNENNRFAQFLEPLEQKWQMSLLLSAGDLEWMASGFDVLDSNRVAGTIVFQGRAESAVPDIADDAEFLGETFRRKFAAEKIDYTSTVSTDGTLVTLDFEVEGLEPLWLRLFEDGVLSLIRRE